MGTRADAEPTASISLLRVTLFTVIATLFPLVGLMAARGPIDGKDDPTDGYWGAKTASVNWCESDYVVSPYIAEFGNTISSFAVFLNGAYGVYAHWGVVEARYICAFCAFLIVGLGSAAFHGTLIRELQLMDELPMVWANMMFIFIVIAIEDAKTRKPRYFEIVGLTTLTIVETVAIIYLDTEDQNVFLVSYGSGVFYLIYRSYKLEVKYSRSKPLALLESSLVFYGAAFAVWLIDRNFCPTVRSLHLHSFWHVGAGLGTFTAVLFWIWVRFEYLGARPKLMGATPFTRYVETTFEV